MKTVLVVDDKEMLRDSVGATLERAGFAVLTAPDGPGALETIAKRRPDAVVTDMRMPGMTGVELIEKLRAFDDEVPVILMTAFGTIDTAVKAMKLGAFDYLTKPFEGDELIIAVRRAMEHRRLVRENAVLLAGGASAQARPTALAAGSNAGVGRLIGDSPAMRELKEQIIAISSSQGTVLVTGESGTGKEVVARAVHEMSGRRCGAYLAVNCAALSESLLESELFGHERGAFTGAERLRKGRFELADGGTLLLDEVSEITPKIQAKLLRVLQERAFERVGSSTTMGVDARVIATSNRDLPGACAKGEFRQDLFFRLSVLPVRVPALRERLEDVPVLAKHFVGEVCKREGRAPIEMQAGVLSLLQGYSWPGNVRELQNICERAVVLASAGKGVITPELVSPWVSMAGASHRSVLPAAAVVVTQGVHPQQIEAKPGAGISVPPRSLEELEREAIVNALTQFNGHRQKTAAALGIGVRTLGLKLKKWKTDGLVPVWL